MNSQFEAAPFKHGQRTRFRQLIAITRLEAECVVVNGLNAIWDSTPALASGAAAGAAPLIAVDHVYQACGGEPNFCDWESFQEVLEAVARKWPNITVDRHVTPDGPATKQIHWIGIYKKGGI